MHGTLDCVDYTSRRWPLSALRFITPRMAYRVGEVYVRHRRLSSLSLLPFEFARCCTKGGLFDVVDGIDAPMATDGVATVSTPGTPPILPSATAMQLCVKRAKPGKPHRAAPLPHLSSDLDLFSSSHLQ
jgi:hypothetical protein